MRIINLFIVIVLIIPLVNAETISCYYDIKPNKYGIEDTKLITLDKSNFYRCPPTLSIYYKHFMTLEEEPYYPSGGGGSASGGMRIDSTLIEPINQSVNSKCIHKCDECYEIGSNLWYDCKHLSIQDNINKTNRNLIIIAFILTLTIGILIGRKLKK